MGLTQGWDSSFHVLLGQEQLILADEAFHGAKVFALSRVHGVRKDSTHVFWGVSQDKLVLDAGVSGNRDPLGAPQLLEPRVVRYLDWQHLDVATTLVVVGLNPQDVLLAVIVGDQVSSVVDDEQGSVVAPQV